MEAVATKRIAFDNERYLAEQSAAILERIEQCDNKLYLEFGGKLLFDYHAARVLPGYDPNVKMRLLGKLKDKADLILNLGHDVIEKPPFFMHPDRPKVIHFSRQTAQVDDQLAATGGGLRLGSRCVDFEVLAIHAVQSFSCHFEMMSGHVVVIYPLNIIDFIQEGF